MKTMKIVNGQEIDFDNLILLLNKPLVNKKVTKINNLLIKRNWTALRCLIKKYSLSGEKVWSDGYALLDKVVQCRDGRLVELLAWLFSSLLLVVKTNNQFPLLKFVFYYSIIIKEKLLIDKIVSLGVSVNGLLERETPLLTAIHTKAGLDIIKLIIGHGACVNGKDTSGFTAPLARVVTTVPFDSEVAELLFSHGADVNAVCTESKTTLVHLACSLSINEGLIWLLIHKANPNTQDKCGNTALHIAVANGDLSSVKFLLEYGTLPNVFNNTKLTPLLIAVHTNNFRIAKLLLQYGAEYCCTTLSQVFRNKVVSCEGTRDSSAVHKILKTLLNYGFVLQVNIHDQVLVHAAAKNGFFGIVKTFLEGGGSPNSMFLNTPLIYDAIKSKKAAIVDILLAYGSYTIYDECIGVSALTISVSSNLIEITELLLSKGYDDLSETCVFIAAENLNIDMLHVLIKFKVNVNTRDAYTNYSPLHFAIRTHKHFSRLIEDIDVEITEVVKLLLNHGLSPWYSLFDLKPDEHPIHFAISLNYVQVVKVLLEAGTSFIHFEQVGATLFPSTILHFAIRYDSNEMVKVLLENGASVDALQFDGRTPLELAVGLHSWNVIRVLLENGANVKSTSECNKNLVFYAIVEESPTEVVTELLKFGADIDNGGYSCKTALHHACSLGNGEVVAVLLDHGADINSVDCEGNTAFMKTEKSLRTMQIFEQASWFEFPYGKYIAGLSTSIYHLQRHAFKINYLGLPLHPCFKPVLEFDYNEDFVSSCKKELQVTKCFKINSSSLCLYDIIKQKQDPAYASNNSVLFSLDNNENWVNFILYGGIFKDCIKKAKERNKLLDSGQKFLSDVLSFSCLHYLPNEIVRKIITYLNNEELQILH